MFRDIKLEELDTETFEGADIKSSYTPPTFPAHGEVEEGKRIYDGNCHCGTVTFSVKWKPVEEIEVLSCNCSLCSRVSSLPFLEKSIGIPGDRSIRPTNICRMASSTFIPTLVW